MHAPGDETSRYSTLTFSFLLARAQGEAKAPVFLGEVIDDNFRPNRKVSRSEAYCPLCRTLERMLWRRVRRGVRRPFSSHPAGEPPPERTHQSK
jgi:hypothetical protein